MSRCADARAELTSEWNRFQESWQEAQVTWKDKVATQFASRFLQPWEVELPKLLARMDAVENELRKAKRVLR